MADVLFSSSDRDEWIGVVILTFFSLLPLEGNNRALNMGAKVSVTPPQIVKTPNQPAVRSGNVVTKRNPPTKVGRVPLTQCM